MSKTHGPLSDSSLTFGLSSCCRQRCWCHWSCRFLSVSIPHSLCSPSVPSNHKQGTLSSTANQNDSMPDSPLELHACNKLSIINQPLTDCLSSSSCLRSQSARERTMVSCGSGVEVSSPRLGEGRAEERGVRGATVSSSILRSWSDGELGQSPTRVKILSDVSYYSFPKDLCFGALTEKHNSPNWSWFRYSEWAWKQLQWIIHTPPCGTSSPPLPPPSALSPTPPSASPARAGTSPVTMATDTGHTAQSLNQRKTKLSAAGCFGRKKASNEFPPNEHG